MGSEFFGPFVKSYKGYNYRCYFYFGQKRTNCRLSYGVLVFNFGYTWQVRFFHHTSPSLLKEDYELQVQGFDLAFEAFMLNNDFLTRYRKRGIVPQGNEPVNSDCVYIHGQKFTVVNSLTEKDSHSFFASSLTSLNKMYDEMALADFKKRGSELAKVMAIPYLPEFELSDALTYIGVNNVRKHRIRLNRALYAFDIRVGNAVIIHELAHCFVLNHNARFYDICYHYCPDYDKYDKIIMSGDFLNNGE